jgi:hypothetical protein
MKIQIDYKQELINLFNKADELPAYFKIMQNYSFQNKLRAGSQLGKLEPIATYKKWQELGYQVKKGEKAIALLMPVVFKKELEDGSEEAKQVFLEKFYWFGLSQTNAPQDFVIDKEIETKFDLNKVLAKFSIKLEEFSTVQNGCLGYARPKNKTIAISPLNTQPLQTAIHEIAHCLLHGNQEGVLNDSNFLDRDIKELEAEGVAYFVCKILGLYNDAELEGSRAYIKHWIKTPDNIPVEAVNRIIKTVDRIIQANNQTLTTNQ